ncbi:MAG: TRAP transporter substrate-binding protein, partial [Hyphomicrobium sp.]
MAATFKEQKFPIQLVLILADDEAAVRRALTRGEADVAFARSLQKFEQARAVAILRKNYLVIWKAPDQKSNR